MAKKYFLKTSYAEFKVDYDLIVATLPPFFTEGMLKDAFDPTYYTDDSGGDPEDIEWDRLDGFVYTYTTC